MNEGDELKPRYKWTRKDGPKIMSDTTVDATPDQLFCPLFKTEQLPDAMRVIKPKTQLPEEDLYVPLRCLPVLLADINIC
jgi:hypothetical protein